MSNDSAHTQSRAVFGHTDHQDPARHHLVRLAQVAQATASAVIITDTEGVTVWVNEGFTRITGYTFAEAIGRVPGRLLQGAETDRGEVARIGAALRARQSVAAELINYTKDGHRYWIGLKIEPLHTANGDFDGFMAIEADITNRHEQRLAIEQLTHRFNTATRAGRIGVFERDVNGAIIWWNDVMWEILGQNPVTFKPSLNSWLGVIHPEDRDRMERMERASQSQAAFEWQYRIIRPDGHIRHVRALGARMGLPEADAKGISGITVDVTEQIQAREREQALQDQLRESSYQAGMAEIATGALHNVGNLLNSLGIANTTARRELKALRLERLEQATTLLRRNRDTLAAFLTQDERGRHLPDYLHALSAQIALNALALNKELETTDELLHHLSSVVNAQQDVARVGASHESVDLRNIVESALLVGAADLVQVEIIREYDDLPPIATDRHKLMQIVVNLISNAADAVQASASEGPRIVVKLVRDGEHVVFSIEDSGIGMSKEVFAQLWRFGFTTKKSGHGFGLHNSANAAHEIGATLTAHSDGVGHGSRFILRLPTNIPDSRLSGVAA